MPCSLRPRQPSEARKFVSLHQRRLSGFETLMAPRHCGKSYGRPHPKGGIQMCGGLVWRNALSRRIWRNPSRFSSAGTPSWISQIAPLFGIWPWEAVRMTLPDLVLNSRRP